MTGYKHKQKITPSSPRYYHVCHNAPIAYIGWSYNIVLNIVQILEDFNDIHVYVLFF